MVWDFADLNPFAGAGGDWEEMTVGVAKLLEKLPALGDGRVWAQPAQDGPLDGGVQLNTDPPYYDNIGYSDLSDYFYVWSKRALSDVFPSLFRRLLVPKQQELVANPFRFGGPSEAEKHFMQGMKQTLAAFAEANPREPSVIYYAYKQSEIAQDGISSPGWTSFLQATFESGFAIDGTWPVRTENSTRLVGMNTSSLASSIVLVCRKREVEVGNISRADFLRRLRAEMPEGLAKIRDAGVGPTDVQQAAIGPGIGIFTRYGAVLNPDGSAMTVSDALKLINQVREELASEAQGDYDPATRFAIDWFMAHGHKTGKAGDAILMANALGLGLRDLELAGIFNAGEGHAQLLSRDQLPDDWSPATDRYPTAWEACQHLIKRLEGAEGGVDAAAALFAELGDLAEPAQQLTFRLYDICNNKGWAAEAQPYSNLNEEWDVIEERSREFAPEPPTQGEMAL
jgi:putative DNA methylase